VSRALTGLGSAVLRLGATRGARYALRRPLFGLRNDSPSSCPIYRLALDGNRAHQWATLNALHGGWHLEWAEAGLRPEWADLLHGRTGFCEGVPFFLTDLRPQGYLGRAIARQLPAGLGWSPDPRDWSDDQTLLYLVQHGHDLPGNLALGENCAGLALSGLLNQSIPYLEREQRYPVLANQANAGAPAGSSVEGEQPKFTCWVHDSDMTPPQAMIVKFTDRLDTPTGQRWGDLLAAEQIAHEILASSSISDAEADKPKIEDFAGRRFLQIPRFDRIGQHGRRGLVSLRALHDAGFTDRDTNQWVIATHSLQSSGWIGPNDARTIRLRSLFGRLIGNTDMHFGNLAFFLGNELPLRLAPVYDMLPMLWRPTLGEAEPTPEVKPVPPLGGEMDLWPEAANLAELFWERSSRDQKISAGFQAIARQAGMEIKQLRMRFG
jgi:hypothetical protein